MILQYLTKFKGKAIETIIDGVAEVEEFPNEINVIVDKNGTRQTTTFPKGPMAQVYNMWLLNDNFKTLKRLI